MPAISVAQLGARMHYAVPAILQRAGLLDRFYTDLFLPEGGLTRLLRNGRMHRLAGQISGRSCSSLSFAKVRTNPLLALEYWHRVRKSRRKNDAEAAFAWAGRAFPKWVSRRLDLTVHQPKAVYAFNTAAQEVFHWCKKHRVLCILEQTMGPLQLEREILSEAAIRFPGWARNHPSPSPSRLWLEQAERNEWQLADLIVCGSSFVAKQLVGLGVDDSCIAVLPYGVEVPGLRPKPQPRRTPLNLLFAGSIGLRKGAPLLLEAARHLSEDVSITLAGSWEGPADIRQNLPPNVRHVGRTPRHEMAHLYHEADLLVLPTFWEGSATVCYEAAVHGLPIITTPNAGFPLIDGINGIMIPPGDTHALIAALRQVISDRGKLRQMSDAMWQCRHDFSYATYSDGLLKLLSSRLGL